MIPDRRGKAITRHSIIPEIALLGQQNVSERKYMDVALKSPLCRISSDIIPSASLNCS
jgi:hypothetical protein